MELTGMPCRCAIMEAVSEETRLRLRRAARAYETARARLDAARTELQEAIVEERKDGGLIEDITAAVPYRQTQVNRILEAAGLTEKRGPRREP
jgi:ribosome recycling factor